MILDAFRLTGKVAIVTGSRTGLGQGMALGLAEAGADIVGIDINHLEETARGLRKGAGDSWESRRISRTSA